MKYSHEVAQNMAGNGRQTAIYHSLLFPNSLYVVHTASYFERLFVHTTNISFISPYRIVTKLKTIDKKTINENL